MEAGGVGDELVRECPSCGCRIGPPYHGWVLCGICDWEGRWSETVPLTPPPERLPVVVPDK